LRKKELIIIAGPNGSGKTTFAKSFLKEKKFEFLNADEIASELGNENKRANAITAGKEYFKRLDKLITKRTDTIIESTLSGLFMQTLIQRFRKEKYSVTIIFVVLDNPQICIERIKERVRKGGHYVTDKDVIRRFYRSKKNFWLIYKNKADQWLMLNNSQQQPKEVATGMKNTIEVKDELLWKQFQEEMN
jgi:predicted ABC-type ATPase